MGRTEWWSDGELFMTTAVKLAPQQMAQRIAYIGAYPLARPPQGGVESAYQALFGLMLEQNLQLNIQVLTSGEGEEQLFDGRLVVRGGLPMHYFLARLRGFPIEQRNIARFVQKLSPRTVVMTSGAYAFLAVEAAKHQNLSVLFTIHGIAEYDVMRERKPWLRKTISARQLRQMTKRAALAADHVVAISGYSAEYVRGLGRTNSTTVIPNAVDPLFEEIRYSNPQTANRLLFVGNLLPLKGLHHLLEAMAILKPRLPNMELTVVGPASDPSYSDELKMRAKDLNLNVSWLGALDKKQVRETMLKSDLLVLPSLIENLPQVLQEAAALGLPFVASNVGGVADLVPTTLQKEVLVHSGNENMLAERIADLLGQPKKLQDIGASLRSYVTATLSNPVVAKKTLDICRVFWEKS